MVEARKKSMPVSCVNEPPLRYAYGIQTNIANPTARILFHTGEIFCMPFLAKTSPIPHVTMTSSAYQIHIVSMLSINLLLCKEGIIAILPVLLTLKQYLFRQLADT